ncbi:MAG: FAD-dependent oxidoreductase [Promethearchaeota archaeon]
MLRHLKLEYDIVIVGGGVAGTCAAIAAARHGSKTVLIQNRSVLGGNASSEIRVHIGGASEHGYHHDARESGIIEEIRLENAVRDPYNTYSWIDMVLFTWCEREKNLDVILNTYVFDVEVENGEIKKVSGMNSGSETIYEFSGKMFIDGTGHGTLGYLAGAEYRVGREGRDEFQESLAPPKPDNYTLGASILFRAEDMGYPVDFTPPDWAKKFDVEKPPRPIPGKNDNHGRYWHGDTVGWWWIEYGGRLDTIHDNERIAKELQSIVFGVWDYIKNHHPNPRVREQSRNFAITWIGTVPGHRESRRLIGDYILNQNDIKSCRVFNDQVAVGGWSIDLHPPGGFWDDEPWSSHSYMEVPYTIPFRCIYSRNIKNLLIASRCLSVTHVAHGSTRLIGTLSTVGQAAGTAADMCVKNGYFPRVLLKNDIKVLQQKLLKSDQWLIGIRNEDDDDLARNAIISSNSEYPCCFDTVDKWIPLYFPMGQRFYLPSSGSGSPEGKDQGDGIEIFFLLRNRSSHDQKISGGLRRDDGRFAFTSKTDIARYVLEVPARYQGWIRASVTGGALDFSKSGNYWLYLNDVDVVNNLDGEVEWGMHCFHWPGTRIGFFHERDNSWHVHRAVGSIPFYDSVFGPRGTFCFKISGVPSPYPAKNINNGFHRPDLGPNLWISAPFKSNPYRAPSLLDQEDKLKYYSMFERSKAVNVHVDFKEEIEFSEIYLTFDTDLDNAFPHQNYGEFKIKDWPIIGKAPNCISDMEIHVLRDNDDNPRKIAEIKDNYQRRVRIKLESSTRAKRIILTPLRNWGFHCFGLYELKIY